MPCYAVFHKNQQIRVFPHEILGDDWKRARTLAIAMAEKAEQNGYQYTVEHFDGISGVGTTVWK
jgi:hypothetical protein